MNFLYAAYAATWIIHIAYQRLRNEIEEIKTKKSN